MIYRQLNLLIWGEGYAKEIGRLENNLVRQLWKLDNEEFLKWVSSIHSTAVEKADRAAINEGYSWREVRKIVFKRDKGKCNICRQQLTWENWHAGHIVDRVMGGSDHPDNIVVMCEICNVYFKPLYESREDYEKWRNQKWGRAL
jgi:hypothetical protein